MLEIAEESRISEGAFEPWEWEDTEGNLELELEVNSLWISLSEVV